MKKAVTEVYAFMAVWAILTVILFFGGFVLIPGMLFIVGFVSWDYRFVESFFDTQKLIYFSFGIFRICLLISLFITVFLRFSKEWDDIVTEDDKK